MAHVAALEPRAHVLHNMTSALRRAQGPLRASGLQYMTARRQRARMKWRARCCTGRARRVRPRARASRHAPPYEEGFEGIRRPPTTRVRVKQSVRVPQCEPGRDIGALSAGRKTSDRQATEHLEVVPPDFPPCRVNTSPFDFPVLSPSAADSVLVEPEAATRAAPCGWSPWALSL